MGNEFGKLKNEEVLVCEFSIHRPVHGPYTQPLGRGRSNRVLIRAACHGEENNLFEGPHFY